MADGGEKAALEAVGFLGQPAAFRGLLIEAGSIEGRGKLLHNRAIELQLRGIKNHVAQQPALIDQRQERQRERRRDRPAFRRRELAAAKTQGGPLRFQHQPELAPGHRIIALGLVEGDSSRLNPGLRQVARQDLHDLGLAQRREQLGRQDPDAINPPALIHHIMSLLLAQRRTDGQPRIIQHIVRQGQRRRLCHRSREQLGSAQRVAEEGDGRLPDGRVLVGRGLLENIVKGLLKARRLILFQACHKGLDQPLAQRLHLPGAQILGLG